MVREIMTLLKICSSSFFKIYSTFITDFLCFSCTMRHTSFAYFIKTFSTKKKKKRFSALKIKSSQQILHGILLYLHIQI